MVMFSEFAITIGLVIACAYIAGIISGLALARWALKDN